MATSNLDDYRRERNARVEAFNRSQLGLDGEAQARHLKRRFRAILRRHERASLARRWARRGLIGALAGGGIYFAIWSASPWPVGVTIRHFAAGVNCSAARTVGLAPALRGSPGYWPINDADSDGIACEPWRRYR
jgi:hypothetical protein